MDSAISKSTQSLTTAEDMRNQIKLIMQPYPNWEAYLTPAPLSIAILGELVFFSSSTDFSINKNPAKDGDKLKDPESFRVCLMQVCNSGWRAFNEAHTSMDQIRLHTAQVPDYMNTAMKILFQGDDEVVNALLPVQLKNIRRIANECLTLSDATLKGFNDVISIISELLEACLSADNLHGKEIEANKKKLEESKWRKQSALENKKMTEKAISVMEKELEKAQESFKKSVDSLPGGWGMIAMDFVGGITQNITAVIDGVTSVITRRLRNTLPAKGKTTETLNHSRDQESARDVVAEINAYSKSAEILNYTQCIQEQIHVKSKDDDIDWKNLYDQKDGTIVTDVIEKQFERISGDLNEISNCPAKLEAQDLCLMGTKICIQLEKYATKGKCDKNKSTEIIQEVLDLINAARSFDCKSKYITNSPAIAPKPPMMFKQENKSENMRPSERAIENAKFAIEQSKAQMNKTRETYEKHMENNEKNQKELTEILDTMRNCELKEIDFKTTTDMLFKGLDAMGTVQEQWEMMVYFFQMVSNIVKTTLNTTFNDFSETSEKTQAFSYNAKLFSKDLLYTQSYQVSNIASLVHMISATYTDVSSKYLMDCVSSLGKLMVMDKSKPESECKRQQLRKSCAEAQKGILSLVKKNKEEFDRKSTERLERIDRELFAILPAAPPEQIMIVKEVVQTAFTEKEEASNS